MQPIAAPGLCGKAAHRGFQIVGVPNLEGLPKLCFIYNGPPIALSPYAQPRRFQAPKPTTSRYLAAPQKFLSRIRIYRCFVKHCIKILGIRQRDWITILYVHREPRTAIPVTLLQPVGSNSCRSNQAISNPY